MGIKGRETIFVLRKNFDDVDDYGNPIISIDPIPVTGCLIAWNSTSQTGDLFGMTAVSDATIQLPPNTPIQKSDEFMLPDGQVYTSKGMPMQWRGQVGNSSRKNLLVHLTLKEGTSNV